MADGSDGTDVSPESEATAAAVKGGEIWGTLEELLLACAVTRHGTGSWDSVAMEVQTRSPVAARPGLTPHSCRLRFRHLHRRFSTVGSGGDEEAAAEAEEDPDASAAEGWVDELRRLRVAELRRDVERCDLSIGTLQSKVKRLREERERSVSGEAKPDEVSANDRLSCEEPGRSCRESNSTDLKPPKHPGHQGGGGGGCGCGVRGAEPGVGGAARRQQPGEPRGGRRRRRRRPGRRGNRDVLPRRRRRPAVRAARRRGRGPRGAGQARAAGREGRGGGAPDGGGRGGRRPAVRGVQGRRGGRGARPEAAVRAPLPRRLHPALARHPQHVPALPPRAAHR